MLDVTNFNDYQYFRVKNTIFGYGLLELYLNGEVEVFKINKGIPVLSEYEVFNKVKSSGCPFYHIFKNSDSDIIGVNLKKVNISDNMGLVLYNGIRDGTEIVKVRLGSDIVARSNMLHSDDLMLAGYDLEDIMFIMDDTVIFVDGSKSRVVDNKDCVKSDILCCYSAEYCDYIALLSMPCGNSILFNPFNVDIVCKNDNLYLYSKGYKGINFKIPGVKYLKGIYYGTNLNGFNGIIKI